MSSYLLGTLPAAPQNAAMAKHRVPGDEDPGSSYDDPTAYNGEREDRERTRFDIRAIKSASRAEQCYREPYDDGS